MMSQRCRYRTLGAVFIRCLTSSAGKCAAARVILAMIPPLLYGLLLFRILPQTANWYKWALTFSLPIFWIAVLFGRAILGLSGKGFIPAWPLLIALAMGNLINVSTGSVGYMLVMTGHQRITFLNSLVAIVFN